MENNHKNLDTKNLNEKSYEELVELYLELSAKNWEIKLKLEKADRIESIDLIMQTNIVYESTENLPDNINNFEKFYAGAREYLFECDYVQTRDFYDWYNEYVKCFDVSTSVYFLDSVILEAIQNQFGFGKILKAYHTTERYYCDKVIENFDKIFHDYEFVKREYYFRDEKSYCRLDILAKEKSTGRTVIIELKKGSKNPANQLKYYAKYFDNPILVSLTEKECKKKDIGIIYMVYKADD